MLIRSVPPPPSPPDPPPAPSGAPSSSWPRGIRAAPDRAVTALGQLVVVLCHHVGGAVLLGARVLGALLRLRVDGRETLRHVDRFGVGVLPILTGGSLIVGGVVAMQGLTYIDRYNATEVFGWAAGLSSFREVGPLLLGMVLASRVGSKNTAEVASMLARERLDALSALGLDPVAVVLAPRALAITLSAALLYPLATTTIFASGVILAWAIGDQLLSVSWYSMTEYLHARDVAEGFLRMTLFGALIGVTSTAFGLRGGQDARSIGAAVYGSSVASITGVVVLNLYLSFLGTS